MKVGDYVRTKYGITQFKEYETTNGEKLLCMPVKDGSQGIFANIEDVVKSSPNIIDLIEVGDYVNGLKVIQMYSPEGKYTLWIKLSDNTFIIDNSEDIKSIATREQFKNIEYEVE